MWDRGWVKDESSRMPTPLVSKLPLITQSSDIFVSCPLSLLTARPILLLVAANWMFLPGWPTVTSTQHVPNEMNYSFTSPPPVSILNSLHSCVFFEKNTTKYKITQISNLGILIISYVTTANLTCITSVFPCLTPSSITETSEFRSNQIMSLPYFKSIGGFLGLQIQFQILGPTL